MFEGTDLSAAYGTSFDSPSPLGGGGRYQQQIQPPPDPTQMAPPIPKGTQSHEMPPEPVYAPPPAMYAQQSPKAYPQGPPGDGFWDRVAKKKWEVFKLFVMSLIILLALSLHEVSLHYLTKYVSTAFLTDTQELVVRIGYPVTVLLVIWLLKASA